MIEKCVGEVAPKFLLTPLTNPCLALTYGRFREDWMIWCEDYMQRRVEERKLLERRESKVTNPRERKEEGYEDFVVLTHIKISPPREKSKIPLATLVRI